MTRQASGGAQSAKSEVAATKAFFFSDLRNYTAFVERSGDAAAAQLLRSYRDIVRRQVSRHRGAEIKTEGDSFYVVFDSASQALRCAGAVQRDVESRNAATGGEIVVGIGLHAGETIAFDRQYVGSAVNIASRLAGKAAPGEILVSDTFRGLIRTGVTQPMTDRGPMELKGVSEPIRAWSVDWRAASEDAEPYRAGLLRLPELRGRRVGVAVLLVALLVVGGLAAYRTISASSPSGALTSDGLPPHGPILFALDPQPAGAAHLLISRGADLSNETRFLGDAIEVRVAPGSSVTISARDLAPDDFVAEFAAAVISGQGTYALWSRGAQGRQLQVQFTPQTGALTIQLARTLETPAQIDRLFGPSSRIASSGSAEQRLVVRAQDHDVVVFAGSRELARASDPNPASGSIGLVFTAAADRPLVVRLTALRVYAP